MKYGQSEKLKSKRDRLGLCKKIWKRPDSGSPSPMKRGTLEMAGSIMSNQSSHAARFPFE